MKKEFEQYVPTAKEIELAEDQMNDEQKKLSEIRAKNWEQKQAPWESNKDNFDENNERRRPTTEEKEKMNQIIIGLGEIFKGTNFHWYLDGAINISLMKGEFIGVHKDVDISVERDELEKLEECLEKKGYAFFHSCYDKEAEENVMRRVKHDKVASSMFGNYEIAAIDQDGKITRDRKINFIDLHVIERGVDGSYINKSGVILPDKWFEPQPTNFMSENINLSHPALVAYHKLQFWREYDLSDLHILAETGKLKLQDIDEIGEVIEKNFVSNEQKGKDAIDDVMLQVKNGMDSAEIFSILARHPILKDGVRDKRELFVKFAEKIAENTDKSSEFIATLLFKEFDVESVKREMRVKISKLRNWVADFEKSKK